jgi:hypothetical protein
MRTPGLLLLLPLLGACRSTPDSEAPEWVPLLSGSASGIVSPGVEIARDPASWAELWARHSAGILPAPEPPAVDFERHQVVFVGAGVRPTAGYGLAVEGLEEDGDRLVLRIRETPPSDEGLVAQVLTTPFEILLIERSERPLEARYLR